MEVQKRWIAPSSRPRDGLKVYNTLSDSKVPFLTKDGSRFVTWYNCGPTVYDSAHLGHARNYLTFDILRRILEGYFGYKVLYVMNITDVDDKIISRARRNHLLAQYRAASRDPCKVHQDLVKAVQVETDKQQKKVDESEEELAKSKYCKLNKTDVEEHSANSKSSKQENYLEEKLKQEKLKLSKLEESRKTMENKVKAAYSLGGEAGVNLLLADSASDTLASQLDAEFGAEITDHAIFRAHSAKYEQEFFNDMETLGVRPPNVVTRVTEFIDHIILYVQNIIDQGFGYHANGSVYFDTKAFVDAGHTYGKLKPWAVGSAGLASESEANFGNSDKKSNSDFALWKVSKRGEPFWDSPWGLGRPGWHIECSAMASKVIGSTLDVHSGGNDLQFPHHDNELAQAEAFYGCSQWVNYFLHSGHLAIDGLKMSKSLKNFITIKEALDIYTSRQLRLHFVLQAWDKPMAFSNAAMDTTIAKEKKLKMFFSDVQAILRQLSTDENQGWSEEERSLEDKLQQSRIQVEERLEDNFDTPGAFKVLLNLVGEVNGYCNQKNVSSRASLVSAAAVYISSILSVFGLSDVKEGEIGWGSISKGGVSDRESILAPFLDAVASFRDDVRAAAKEGASKAQILALADQFRDEAMVELGVRLTDKGERSSWSLEDNPDILRKERDDKLSKAMEERLFKLQKQRERLIKELDKWQAASEDPKDFFKGSRGHFSAFDADGFPTHDSNGVELTASSKKRLKKDLEAAKKAHQILKQKEETDPTFLEVLKKDLKGIDQELLRLKTS